MTNTTTDLQARMEALVRRLANKGVPNNSYSIDLEEARAIVAELPEPIDPDETEALAIVSAWYGFEVLGNAPELAKAKRRAVDAYKRIKSGGVA